MKKRSTLDLTVEQKWAIIAKLNLYTCKNDQKVEYGGVRAVAEFFKMHQSSIAKIKRQYWDAINNDEMYPDLQPQKRGRVGSKLELTQELERNIAKLNKKTKADWIFESFQSHTKRSMELGCLRAPCTVIVF